MTPSGTFPSHLRHRLRCPVCHAPLTDTGDERLACTNAECGTVFPVVSGVPVLINEANSVFSIDDFVTQRDTTFQLQPTTLEAGLKTLLGWLPDITASVGTERNYVRFRESLMRNTATPSVLVVGGSILGAGMDELARDPRIELVSTDVSLGPLTALVCDSHDLPFENDAFDGIIVQAVLEHVVDPRRCVDEIYRVLKPGALVYAETPFIQQVHMGKYDFTRFTHSGHRRLFRNFAELASGPICGPGMALAWSYEYFLLSFARSRVARGLLRAFARLTAFHLKYFDSILVHKAGAIDAASGFFFLGRKEGPTLSDRELLRYYRGALSN